MNQIPKKIHYCWYSGEAKDAKTQRCIDSWRKHLPDYEIIEWNATNCDIDEELFPKTAFKARKWAQVADYFRLKVLYEHGGIYLDADVLVNKPFDELLKNRAFFPIEGGYDVINAVMGAVPGCEVIEKMMKPYLNVKYESAEQMLGFMHYMTHVLKTEYGFKPTGFTQSLKDGVLALAPNILLINVDDGENICEHLYAASWLDVKQKEGVTHKYIVLAKYFHNIFGRPDVGDLWVAQWGKQQGTSADYTVQTALLTDDIKDLISTMQKGLEYVREDIDKNKHLIPDINEAVSVIADELKISAPSPLEETGESISDMAKWLQSVVDGAGDNTDKDKVISELTREIKRLGDSVAVTDIPVESFGPAKFYSECGEDAVLLRIFYNDLGGTVLENGTYIDVGAHHPTRMSNTYVFYKLGWTGINIGADPDCVEDFRMQRPLDINLNYTLAPQGDRLRDILSEHFHNLNIDFMTVDAEGNEMDILESNDWGLYRPLILLVKILPGDGEYVNTENTLRSSPVVSILKERGYRCFTNTLHTFFFFDSLSERKYIVENRTRGD